MAPFIYVYSRYISFFNKCLYKHLTSAFNVNIKRILNNFLPITIAIAFTTAIITIIIIIIVILEAYCCGSLRTGNFPGPVFTAIGYTWNTLY